MDYLIYFCAVILPWVLSGGLIGYFFISKNKIGAIKFIGLSFLSAIIAWFLASLYKYNFPSPRPFEVYANLKPLFATYHGDSFPSGHATFMGALAMSVFLQNGFDKLAASKMIFSLVFIIGAILVAVARVLAHVHSSGDVVVGLLFGSLVSIVIWLIYQKFSLK